MKNFKNQLKIRLSMIIGKKWQNYADLLTAQLTNKEVINKKLKLLK